MNTSKNFVAKIPEISFDIVYTAQDFYEANKINLWSRVWPIYLLGLIFLFVAIAMVISARFGLMFFYLLLSISFLSFRYTWFKFFSHKVFESEKTGNTHMIINKYGIKIQTLQVDSNYTWTDFLKIIHSKTMLVIYISKRQIIMVPRRVIIDEDVWNKLIQLS